MQNIFEYCGKIDYLLLVYYFIFVNFYFWLKFVVKNYWICFLKVKPLKLLKDFSKVSERFFKGFSKVKPLNPLKFLKGFLKGKAFLFRLFFFVEICVKKNLCKKKKNFVFEKFSVFFLPLNLKNLINYYYNFVIE